MNENIIDDEYYEVASKGSFSEKIMIKARSNMFETFSSLVPFGENTKVLDFGVSDTITNGDNFFEKEYPFPEKIIAVGLGVGTDFRKAYPEVGYQQIHEGERLPFDDGHFDVAVSNAVIEHVGSPENQRFMLKELGRVADRVFITAPNRYFPVEHHTGIPILHWSDGAFEFACRVKGCERWTEPDNLILMNREKLRDLGRSAWEEAEVGYTGLKLGRFSSNLYLCTLRDSGGGDGP